MTTTLSPSPFLHFSDNNGNPAAQWKLFTYQAGTTTKTATYTDSTGGTPNANPIILDSRGEANVWLLPNIGYKYVLALPTDTDPPTAPVKTVDNILNSVLTSLYGGVDTGVANVYLLTFTATFSSYADGIVIYWVPSHSNTAGSTINVNGIGVVSITNADGSPLTANQLVANQMAAMAYKGGAFRLLLTGTNPQVLPFFTQLTAGTTALDAASNPFTVGFLDIPQNIQNANYTLVAADRGKHVYHSDGVAYTWTIPANASVAYPIGCALTFVNDSSGAFNITIAITTDTLVWVPSGATGSRTLAQFGRATALKVAATRWWISGIGLT